MVVCHQNAGYAQVVMNIAQPSAQFFAHFGIQRAEGFVQKQEFRFDRKRAGEGDALALTAGELVRIVFGEVGELHEFEQFFDFGTDLFFGRAFGLGQYGQTEGDVVKHVHVAEKGVVLEHEADFTLAYMLGGDVLPIKENLATVGVFQPGDDAQERGFAAAGRAEQGNEFAGGDVEVDVFQRVERSEVFV